MGIYDRWGYKLEPIPAAAQGATSGSYMVLDANANHQIRYVPFPNAFTMGGNNPSLSIRAWDKSEEGGQLRADDYWSVI